MVTSIPGAVSPIDERHLSSLRSHVAQLFHEASRAAAEMTHCQILDIAPQDHGGVRPYLQGAASLQTLDIDPQSGADIIGDICRRIYEIPDSSLDIVICTEVLEHVSNPFAAVDEIYRMLRPGGVGYFSAPFNFRIHGPLPDNWRFTEYGWRQLLSAYTNVKVTSLETDDRVLTPIHYNVVAIR